MRKPPTPMYPPNQNGGRGKIGSGDLAMGPIIAGEIFFKGPTPSDRITHGPVRKWRGGVATNPLGSVPWPKETH